jgi:hypothetical protein
MTAVVNALYDTNILLYAVDTAPASATKRAKAIELMLATDYGVSAQVLAEFFSKATRKLPTPVAQALRWLRDTNFLLGRRDPRRSAALGCHSCLFRRPQPRPNLRQRARHQPLSINYLATQKATHLNAPSSAH